MKTYKKILATALIPLLVGCNKVQNSENHAEKQVKKPTYATYKTKTEYGDNLSYYLTKEGFPISLDSYINLVQDLNKNNKRAFVNYSGGQIRDNRDIILPDLNNDGKVAGKDMAKEFLDKIEYKK